jgi:ATP/ADP translocase
MTPPAATGPGAAYLRLLSIFRVQPGEVARALLVFGYLFLIIAAYLMMKGLRNALFIAEFGAMKLPYVMIGIPLLAGLFAVAYVRLARRWSTPNLVFWSLVFFASNMLVFWFLAGRDWPWVSPLFYLWVGAFGVVGTMQVWTLASELFTTREAKRVFGLVGAGGILGGFMGGEVGGRLAPVIGASNLMLGVIGMLLLAAALVALSRRFRMVPSPVSAGQARPRNLTESLKVISGSKHLRLLAGLVFISALATTSIEFQYSVTVDNAMDGADALASFFLKVRGRISIIALLVQILLTSRLLASVGVGFSILLLPLSLVSGTAALFVSGSLWAAVFLKGSDGSLKHSLDRSCRELMYLPVPSAIRAQAKSTIDTVMDRLGDGSAGLLQLLMTAALGFGMRASLGANFVLIGIWLFLALRLRAAYVSQLGLALGRRRRQAEALPAESDADARRALERLLRTSGETEKLAVLEWIGRNAVPVDEKVLLGLAHERESPAVRNAALGLLLSGDEGQLPPELLARLEQEGQTVLVAAIDLLVEPEPQRLQQRLEALLATAGDTTRLSVVAFMLRRLGPEFEPFARQVFEALLKPGAPSSARAAAVRALALLPPEANMRDRLDAALADTDPIVASAALETAARLERTDLLPVLSHMLAKPGLRQAVRQSFLLFGEKAVPQLLHDLEERRTPAEVRRHLPRVLGELCTPRSVDALVGALDDEDAWVRQGSLEALRGVRRLSPEIRPLSSTRLHERLFEQMEAYEDLLAVEEALRGDPDAISEGLSWLVDALESERFRILDRMFMLLSLQHSVPDMTRSWYAVRGGSPRERANAVELLDNVLPKQVKSRLLGLLEPSGHRIARGWRTRHERLSRSDALRQIVTGSNPWLAACALYAGRATQTSGLAEVARAATASRHEVLREEARAYLDAVEGVAGA